MRAPCRDADHVRETGLTADDAVGRFFFAGVALAMQRMWPQAADAFRLCMVVPAESLPSVVVEAYCYTAPQRRDWSTVEILKALACFEYQACEAPDWENSSAHRLCRAMERELIVDLPGWSDGPWSISPTTAPAAFAAARRKSKAAAR